MRAAAGRLHGHIALVTGSTAGIGRAIAWRLAQDRPNTYSMSVNDHGFELLAAEPIDVAALLDKRVFRADALLEDVLASLNSGELALRRFREIARVAGLVFTGYPGAPRSNKQLQASSGLLWDVFNEYDPRNLLLRQATREVLERQLEASRLDAALERMRGCRAVVTNPRRPTPFAFPLIVELFREKLTTEALEARVARMVAELEAAAQDLAGATQ